MLKNRRSSSAILSVDVCQNWLKNEIAESLKENKGSSGYEEARLTLSSLRENLVTKMLFSKQHHLTCPEKIFERTFYEKFFEVTTFFGLRTKKNRLVCKTFFYHPIQFHHFNS